MLNRMDRMNVDYLAEGEAVPMIRNQKHMQRFSDTINPLHMRADSASYHTALKRTMSTIERNLLIANIIEQMGRAESDNVRDMILNYFKVPFGFTDVKAQLGPMNLGTDNIVSKLNRIPGINVDPNVAQEWFRIMSSTISAQYLSGVGTAIQNMTAVQQNKMDWGFGVITKAQEALKEDPDGWTDFIQRSGVVEFRDFFNKSLTADYIHDSIEIDTHEKILGEIMRYYAMKRIFKKNKGKLRGVYSKAKSVKDLEDILQKEIQKIIAASPNYMKWEGKNYIPSEGRVVNRKNILKTERIKKFAQKYVNWAITKEWEFSPVIKKITTKTILPKMIKAGPGALFKYISDIVANSPFTMSAGEEKIRTISFIIGVQRAMEHGIIKTAPIGELKGEDLKLAMEFGMLYSRAANFGLTPQDAPSMFHSPVGGGFVGKFKIWSIQKFAKDWNTWKKGLNSMMEYEDVLTTIGSAKQRKSWKAFFKNLRKFYAELFREFYRKDPSTGKRFRYLTSNNTRMNNHEFAQLRDFLLIQGPLTLFMDIILFGPAGGYMIRYAMRKFGLQSVGGMRSDLLGLMLMPLTITIRALWEDEDEDVTRWAVSNLLRHSFIGLGPQKAFDTIWSIMNGIINNESEDLKHGIYEAVDPVIPFRGVFGPIIKQAAGVKTKGI